MIKSSTTNKEARRLAKKLLAEAKENEPNITADLQTIASAVSAKVVGLENKFKSEESMTRKLVDKSYGSLSKLPKKAVTINDVLRYTFVLPIEKYTENVHRTIASLKNSGYRIPEHKIWNAWQNIGNGKDRGYRGINITVISSQSQKFELQFHTKESFVLKEKTHFLYEELRNRKISIEREEKLIDILRETAANIKRPDGV